MPHRHTPSSASGASPLIGQPEDFIRGLYRGLLGREPDSAGMRHWMETIALEGDPAAVLHGILGSDEYRQKAAARALRQPMQDSLVRQARRVFENRPLTIVDVGAQLLEGEQHVYSPLAEHRVPCRLIGFEPLEHKLQQRSAAEQGEHIHLFPTFIGDGGAHVFHINNDDATSSLLPLNSDLTSDLVGLSGLRTEQTQDIMTSTLDDVLDDCARIDFLKLDIQGFELPVLKNAPQTLGRTSVIHCEVAFAEIYRGQALFSEVELELRRQGFYFLDFSFSCRYPYHCASGITSQDRLGWADAVFFRERELLSTQEDLLAQALIAQLVYRKHSLAEYLTHHYELAAGPQSSR